MSPVRITRAAGRSPTPGRGRSARRPAGFGQAAPGTGPGRRSTTQAVALGSDFTEHQRESAVRRGASGSAGPSRARPTTGGRAASAFARPCNPSQSASDADKRASSRANPAIASGDGSASAPSTALEELPEGHVEEAEALALVIGTAQVLAGFAVVVMPASGHDLTSSRRASSPSRASAPQRDQGRVQRLRRGLGAGQPDLRGLDRGGEGVLPGVGRGGERDPRIGLDLERLPARAAVHGQLDGVAAGRNPAPVGVGVPVRQLGRQRAAQRPDEAVHPGRGGEDAGARQPLGRGVGGRGIHRRGKVRAGVAPQERAGRIADLERDRRARGSRQHVVDPGAEGRVRGRGLVLGQRRAGEGGGTQPEGRGGLEQPRLAGPVGGPDLAQGAESVQDPEAAPVGGDDEVVAVDLEVAHGDARQVELQRLPVVAVVERDVHAELGGGVQQAPPRRVLADRVDEVAVADAGHDQLPVPAAVAGAVEVGRRSSRRWRSTAT